MSELLSGVDTDATLKASIALPYTLTTGRAAGAFLTALESQRLLVSRCNDCDRTVVPATDFCSQCGGGQQEYSYLPANGTVTAFTKMADKTMAMVLIDGTASPMIHQIVSGDVTIGSRVGAVWNPDVKQSVLAMAGFATDIEDNSSPESVTLNDESSQTVPYSMKLDYEHSYGPYYGRLFDELASHRRIVGSKCPSCLNVLVPPRPVCDLCYEPTAQFVDVADTGRVQAFSVINLEFVGQTRKPPYVYAEIVLDGSATRLIHNIDGIDMATAKERLSIGMRVRAVWRKREECVGTLDDIEYFEPIDPA